MEELAEETASTLKEEVGTEQLVGVSYYHEEGVGHVFRSDWAKEKYEPEQVDEIVEELRFDALSHVLHEEPQQETLRATVRVYDEMLDISMPTNEVTGVVFALVIDGDFSVLEVIDIVEQTVREAESAAVSSDR